MNLAETSILPDPVCIYYNMPLKLIENDLYLCPSRKRISRAYSHIAVLKALERMDDDET